MLDFYQLQRDLSVHLTDFSVLGCESVTVLFGNECNIFKITRIRVLSYLEETLFLTIIPLSHMYYFSFCIYTWVGPEFRLGNMLCLASETGHFPAV